MWVDRTFLDTWASCLSAQLVLPASSTSPVPTLSGSPVAEFATFIIMRDKAARHDAFSFLDYSGAWSPKVASELGLIAGPFRVLHENSGYSVDEHITAFIANPDSPTIQGTAARTPALAGEGPAYWEYSPGVALHDSYDGHFPLGSVQPAMRRQPSGQYSAVAAQRSGALLEQLRQVYHTRSVAIDAGLAATAAAAWSAKRAQLLAAAQSTYPSRAYV